MAERITRDAVVAFRLKAHHLDERLGEDGLLAAAGACGVQNSPPTSAALALHARVRGVTLEGIRRAVAEDKTLLQTWAMRGAPYFFPTVDAPVFTAGVMPPGEEEMRHFVLGVGPALDALGMSLTEIVEAMRRQLGAALSGRRLAIDELGRELAERMTPMISPARRDVWLSEGPYAPGQPIGEAVVHFGVRILCLRGLVCFASRERNKAPFVLTREWLGRPMPELVPDWSRGELSRRYLRCYGPSSRADFASWLGLRASDVDPWWRPIAGELVRVDFGGERWLLADDMEALRPRPRPRGVRLLPPGDPYTQQRDRDTILDRSRHRRLWKAIGAPGAVLADGEVVGAWRARKSGGGLDVSVEPFRALSRRREGQIRAEADQIAPLRGCESASVGFGEA